MKIDVGLIKSIIKDNPVDNIVYNIGSSHEVLCNLLIGTELLWEGHESGDWIIDKEATDTLTGRRHKECTRCGKLLESEIYASDTYNEKYFTFYAASGGLSIEAKEGVTLVDEIVIPSTYRGESVTHIEPDAFKNCTYITKITIPKSIVSIGDRAFQGCYHLKSVEFAEGSQLTEIGVEAFDGCVPLSNITIPDSVTSIGNYAFYNCGDLATVVIGDNVETIGERAFAWCWDLQKVVIPDSVTSIGYGVFAYCNKDLVIYCEAASQPEGWDSRWNVYDLSVIWDCYCPCGEVISSIIKTVEPTCTTQGYTLRFCESCGSYSVSYSAALGHSYVKSVKKATCDETDGMGYTKYSCSRCGYYYKDDYTSKRNHSWRSEWLIKIEPSETSLGIRYQECYNCDAENTSFIFPMHSCTEGGNPSFSVKRNVPPTCQSEGYVEYACDYCGDTFRGTHKKLPHITSKGVVTPPTCQSEGYTTYACAYGDSYVSDYNKQFPHNYEVVVKKPTCTEPGSINYVCKDCGYGYRGEIYGAAIGHDWGEITVDNTTGYSIRKCSHCGGVEIRSAYEGISGNINIPSTIDGGNVIGIGDYCFDGCVNITSITLPDSITYIGDGAFEYCSGLLNVNISENSQLVSIGDDAFAWSNIRTIAIPDNVTSISNECFFNSRLETITFGENSKLSTIWERAFVSTSLRDITIPSEVAYIGERAFYDCTLLETVTFAENSRLQGIMERAFSICGLTSLTLPEGCFGLGDGAFSQCTDLAEINLPSTLLSIGEESTESVFQNTAYYNDESNWTDGVLYIGKWLIAVKSTVTEVEVASNCSSIGAGAISSFTHAASIKIPLSVKNIQAIAFTESENLTIYCEAPIKPEGWKDNWCDDSVTVVWGYVEDTNTYLVTESGEFLTDEQGNLLIL